MIIKKRSRVVIDTNIWISFLIGKSFSDFDDILIKNEFIVLYSKELMEEVFEVIDRPKLIKYFKRGSKRIIKTIFEDLGEEIRVRSEVDECRDKKDNFLLSLCRDGKSDLMITSDIYLLVLKRFDTTNIITYNKLKKLI